MMIIIIIIIIILIIIIIIIMNNNEMKLVLLFSAHIHPKNAHGAGGIPSKCIEVVPAEDRTQVTGVPTLRSNHSAKSPSYLDLCSTSSSPALTHVTAVLSRLSLGISHVDLDPRAWNKLWDLDLADHVLDGSAVSERCQATDESFQVGRCYNVVHV
jgi:hypothetical protein